MRCMILSIFVVVGGLLAWGVNPASAQTYLPNPGIAPSTGSVPPGSWSGYPPVSPWEGYQPGLPWSGYNPPRAFAPTTPPPTAYPPRVPAPTSTRAIRTPTVGIAQFPGTATIATGRTVVRNQPYFPGSRLMVPPSQYREYGTGRNIYLHKPWLPNQ